MFDFNSFLQMSGIVVPALMGVSMLLVAYIVVRIAHAISTAKRKKLEEAANIERISKEHRRRIAQLRYDALHGE